MTPMDCGRFEAELAGLLASPEGGSASRVSELRRHAQTCPECRGALALVELGGAPAAARDPIPDPGPGYWSEFERGLAKRLEHERSAAPVRTRVARALLVVAAAAAVAAAALIVLQPEPAPEIARVGGAAPQAGVAPAPSAAPAPEVVEPPHRDRSATGHPAPAVDTESRPYDDDEDAFSLGTSTDPFAEVDDPGLFPRLDDLDAAQAAALSSWLEQEERRVKRGAA